MRAYKERGEEVTHRSVRHLVNYKTSSDKFICDFFFLSDMI